MTRRTRRGTIAGGVSFLVAGCIGPVAEQDNSDSAPTDGTEDEFTDEDLDTIVAVLEDIIAFLERAATLFEEWKADPAATDVEAIDGLRSDATAHLSDFWDDVLPFEEELRNVEDWDGDGEALAETLSDHEVMLRSVEDASIAIVNAGGDPEHVTQSGRDAIDFVIEERPALIEATENALPD